MPNAFYNQVNSLLTTYLSEDQTQKVLTRQLERCDATPESFSKTHLKSIINFVIGASVIYIKDETQRKALKGKLNAFA